MKQRVNVYDPETNKRRIGVLDCGSQIVTTSDKKKRKLSFFKLFGDVKFFEKMKKGKIVRK